MLKLPRRGWGRLGQVPFVLVLGMHLVLGICSFGLLACFETSTLAKVDLIGHVPGRWSHIDKRNKQNNDTYRSP